MAQVTIVINSREYAIACEDGQENRILELSKILEEKAQMLKNISGQINENMLLAMIGILVADDLVEARRNYSSDDIEVEEYASEESIDLSAVDEEISQRLKIVRDEIKAVANELELM